MAVAPAEPGALAPVPVTERGRAEVLGWLQSAFDEVRAEMGAIKVTARRQRRALDRLARRGDGEVARLVALTEALPSRLEEALAVAAAAADQDRADRRAVELELAARVELSRQVAEASAAELGQAIDRLAAAESMLAERMPARSAQETVSQVAGAAWQAVGARLAGRRPAPAPGPARLNGDLPAGDGEMRRPEIGGRSGR